MKIAFACCSMLFLGLAACGGKSDGNTTVTGGTPQSIRTSPAGAALMSFLDLLKVRPDMLGANGAALPAGISTPDNGATYVFSGQAANTGSFGGRMTVSVQPVPGPPAKSVYTETFTVTVTTPLPAGTATDPAAMARAADGGTSPSQTWTYSGTVLVTVPAAGGSATLSLPTGTTIQAALVDTGNPANNVTYQISLDLTATWGAIPGQTFALTGSYMLDASNGDTITLTPSGNLAWTSGCDYPTSGQLTVDLISGGTQTDSVQVTFNGTCGQLSIGGISLALGQ